MGDENHADENQSDSVDVENGGVPVPDTDKNHDLVYITDKLPFIQEEYNYWVERAILPVIAFFVFLYFFFTGDGMNILYGFAGIGVMVCWLYVFVYFFAEVIGDVETKRSMTAEKVEEIERNTTPALMMGGSDVVTALAKVCVFAFIALSATIVAPVLMETFFNMEQLNTLGEVFEFIMETEFEIKED